MSDEAVERKKKKYMTEKVESSESLLTSTIERFQITFGEAVITTEEMTGTEWKVLLIKAGVSLNNREYPLNVLRRDKAIFENVPVHAAIGEDHSMAERGVQSVIGFIKDVQATSEGLEGTLHVSSSDMKEKMLDFHNEGVLNDMMGLSIVAMGEFEPAGNGVMRATKLESADSVDLVREPAAGGKIIGVTESKEDSMTEEERKAQEESFRQMFKEELSGVKESIEEVGTRVAVLEKPDEEDETEEKVVESVPTPEPVSEAQKEQNELMRELLFDREVEKITLPEASMTRIRESWDVNPKMKLGTLRSQLSAEQDYFASLEKTAVENLRSEGRFHERISVDEGDKFLARIDAMFKINGEAPGFTVMEDGEKVPAFRNFTEAWAALEGRGAFDIDRQQLAIDMMRGLGGYNSQDRKAVERLYVGEAVFQTSTLGEVTADRMHKALIKNYGSFPQYDDWRKVATPMSANDYITHRYIKSGGYANLSQVVEAGTYPEITHFGDEEATAAMQKRGGIVPQITRELFLNDSVGVMGTIPFELARAALRTLYQAVFDTFVDNDTYTVDSVTLFHSDHANTGTTALSISGLNVANVAMRSQTKALSTSDVLGSQNKAVNILVPNELEGLAERIANPSGEFRTTVTADTDSPQDAHRWKGKINPIVVDYWTDANDYFVTADISQIDGLGVVFLGGRQEPEIFIQGDERSPDMFNMDVQNVKIRHEWVKVILDYRPFYRQVVS